MSNNFFFWSNYEQPLRAAEEINRRAFCPGEKSENNFNGCLPMTDKHHCLQAVEFTLILYGFFIWRIVDNPHTHGKPEIIPEPIEIDYDNELTLRYLKLGEYPAGYTWWNYNPLIEGENFNVKN